MPSVGRWRKEEVRTMIVFSITALLWMTRKEPFGGWSEWFGLQTANDASVALLNTGPGSDVDSELPGIGRFDHAIVHVPGPPEIWIESGFSS